MAEVHLPIHGSTRTALIRRGSSAGADAPVVFTWHGWGGSAASSMGALRPEKHFEDMIVVAATGLPRGFKQFGDRTNPGWQVTSEEFDGRDLALFDALLEGLEQCGTPQAVYSTGFSNGGFFSNLIGCERADRLTAIAPVGGGGPFTDTCGGAVPVMITHGRKDDVVGFDMAENSHQQWAKHNGCEVAAVPDGEACAASTCEADVRFCAWDGPHRWPGDASERIAGFFQEHWPQGE